MTPDEPEPEPFDLDAEPPPGFPWMLTAAGVIWTTFGVLATAFSLLGVGVAVAGVGLRGGEVGICCLPFTILFIEVGIDTARGRFRMMYETAILSAVVGVVWGLFTLLAIAAELANNQVTPVMFTLRVVNGACGGSLVVAAVLAIVGRVQLRKREQAARDAEHEREPE